MKAIQTKNLKIVFLFTALLVTSIFVSSYVIAESNPNSDLNQEVDISAASNQSRSDVLEATINDSEEQIANNASLRKIGLDTVFLGQGWIISGNEGHLVDILWVRTQFASIANEDVKQIRKEVKTNKSAALEDLKQAANGQFVTRANGRLRIGVGSDLEVLKLSDKTMANGSINFEVYSAKSKINNSTLSIGNLSIHSTKLSNIVLWSGKLTLTSGKHIGTYDINIAGVSKTTLVKNPNEKGSNGFMNGEGKREGPFARFLGFFRGKAVNKANLDS